MYKIKSRIEERESIPLHAVLYYVTLYECHDLCNDIHELEGSQFVPIQRYCNGVDLRLFTIHVCMQSHNHA